MELIWAYGDMLLLSASLVMGYQFKRFNAIVTKAFGKASSSLRNGRMHPRDLEDLRLFHWEIAKAVKVNCLKCPLNSLIILIFRFPIIENQQNAQHPDHDSIPVQHSLPIFQGLQWN